MKKLFSLLFILFISVSLFSQTNETPQNLYKWKGDKKTELQSGYVVLKSGKRLEGQIALKGSYGSVEEVQFVGDGKDISFPAAALNYYGLNVSEKQVQMAKASASGPVNESDENLYEWMNGGIVMNKVVTNSKPRDGYVILTSGKRVEGELKVQRRDDDLWNFQLKTSGGKEKFKAEEVAKFGLNVSASEITQSNLADMDVTYFPGSVTTSKGTKNGEVAMIRTSFYSKKILFKAADGTYAEHTPDNAYGFNMNVDGEEKAFVVVEDAFVEDEFNGATFQLYRNPNPTTINRFATNLVKAGAQVGTTVAATAIVNKDAKENGYVTNMDSVIRVSSKEELIDLRDKLLQLGGYSSVDEMNDNSNNESLKNNVNAIDLAIGGKEFAESDEGIFNQEWIILNKNTGEKRVVFKSDFEEQVQGLLFGCYEYLSLDKSDQKEYAKWKNLKSTVAFLDGCY